MTTATRHRYVHISLSAAAILAVGIVLAFAIPFFAHLGIVHAQVTPPPIVVDPPSMDQGGLLVLLLNARYLPLVGALLVIGVKLLRTGAGSLWSWFATKPGGYVISFTTTFGLYIGGTMQTGGAVTYPLIATALVMTFAAAGGWEMFRDVITALKGPALSKTTTVVTLVLLAGIPSISCATVEKAKTNLNAAGKAIVECAKLEADKLTAFALTLAIEAANDVITTGKVDWDAKADRAWAEGTNVGTCAFASYWAATHPAGAETAARSLGAVGDPSATALAHLRAKADGVTWRVTSGRDI